MAIPHLLSLAHFPLILETNFSLSIQNLFLSVLEVSDFSLILGY